MSTATRGAPAVTPRAATAPIDCLYTTVQNTSGHEAVFSFLPPHGRRMAVQEQLTVAGNIVDRLAVKTSRRQFQALERALAAGVMAIISTPSVFVYDDAVTAPGAAIDPKAIGQSAGVLGMVDPCWAPVYLDPPKVPA
jgi:hypothetical protein